MAAQASKVQTQAPLTSSPYPFAAAPDIIRAHQKDGYFQGVLANQLTDLHRRLRGARAAHAWAAESNTAAELLYLGLTTLLGNRTLGEEYCDLVQVEEPTPLSRYYYTHDSQQASSATHDDANSIHLGGGPLLPSLARRAGYMSTSILLPYLAARILPSVRAAVRTRLQDRLAVILSRQRQQQEKQPLGSRTSSSLEYRVGRYVLTHLSSLSSGAHIRALALAAFYFGGAYYSLSKWLFGLRYVFMRRPPQNSAGGDGRGGYEVLGVLLVVQIAVRAFLQIKAQLDGTAPVTDEEVAVDSAIRERALASGGGLSLDVDAYSSNNALLVDVGPGVEAPRRSLAKIGASTHTPVADDGRPRFDLGAGDGVMGWIKGRQQRQCTLCLEAMRDPAATQCGHMFCWACIGDWVREKPECPLCRRQAMVQHIMPLRGG